MRRFETAMGFPADGSLNAAERAFLLESQQRAMASADQPPYDDILAAEGRDGLLKRYRDEKLGIPAPAFTSALAYYDGYRRERLPANLLQAQRDYFGAHTYERTDKPAGETFHTEWPEVID